MSLWPDSLVIDGVAIALADVLADVTIHVGRLGVNDEPTASTCQVTLHDVDRGFVKAFRTGASFVVTATDGARSRPRFTGRVTDAVLDVDRLTAIAVGRLATLTQYVVGDVGVWPVESWSARVTRIFTDAGLAVPNLVPNGDFETDIAPWYAEKEGVTVARSTLEHKVGAASLEISSTTSAGADYARAVGSFTPPAPIPAGTPVSVRCWAKGTPTPGVSFGLVVYGDWADPIQINAGFTGEWQLLEAVGTYPTDKASFQIYVGTAYYPGPGSFRCYVDAVEVRPSAGDVLELAVDPTFDPQLAARDSATAGPTTVGDYLTFLAPMLGAAVVDRPDGRILVQAVGSRTLDAVLELDPADVEYAPVWSQVQPAGNVVTVRYTGDQSESVTVRDETSVGLHGAIPATVETSFVDVADATRRANQRLARGAYPHWNILQAPILRALELDVGEPVELSSLPPAAPNDPWTPIVEGWSEQITGDEWTMQVALSDPLASGLLLPWETVPAGDLWQTINQSVAWRDALTVEDLANA